MIEFHRIKSTVLATFLILLTLPLQAGIQHSHPSVTQIQGNTTDLTVGDIIDDLKPERTNGGGGSKGGLCVLAPAPLVNGDTPIEPASKTLKIWTEQPVFLWQGDTVKRIELYLEESDEVLWSAEISEGTTGILYNGEPLQPGQTYKWKIMAPFAIEQPAFQVMNSEERDRITADLTQLQEKLQGASEENIALEKAYYFAKQELWADALRELYTVSNPSPTLTEGIAQLQTQDFCSRNE